MQELRDPALAYLSAEQYKVLRNVPYYTTAKSWQIADSSLVSRGQVPVALRFLKRRGLITAVSRGDYRRVSSYAPGDDPAKHAAAGIRTP